MYSFFQSNSSVVYHQEAAHLQQQLSRFAIFERYVLPYNTIQVVLAADHKQVQYV